MDSQIFHFTRKNEYDIITQMVHYSSHTFYYEGGAKNPLKGTSLKLCIFARNASFVYLYKGKKVG